MESDMTIPIMAGVLAWLKGKFPNQKPFPAPNNQLQLRLNTQQYEVYFISNADEAFTAAANISQRALLSPALTHHGVIIADSAATAADLQVQSAINSNTTGATTYLGYLTLKEVKKWPPSAP
jgi:hypothetical protein